MCADLTNRLTPTPLLLSLAPNLIPFGTHQLGQCIAKLLEGDTIQSVDIVSYRTDINALEKLKILNPRKSTRILLVPPDGITHKEAESLIIKNLDGLQIRQIDDAKVPELIHLKLLILTASDGREYAITGSANFTTPGTSFIGNPNSEFSVLFELVQPYNSEIKNIFENLWNQGARVVDPYDFFSSVNIEDEKQTFTLISFQRDALEKLKKTYANKKKEGGAILALPTGAGKTLIAARFLLDCVLIDTNNRVLWLAPYQELLFQAASTFERLSPFFRIKGLKIPDENVVVYNKQDDISNVEFRTVKSAYDWGTYTENPLVVVIDEAHYGASFSRKMLPTLKKWFSNSFFLGLTGTPYRKTPSESRHLNTLFGDIIYYERPEIEKATDTQGRKVLANVESKTVKTGYRIQIDESKLEAEELKDQALREFNHPVRNKAVAREWNNSYGKTLVFAIDIDHANNLARAFNEEHPSVPIQVVHSNSIPRKVPSIVRPQNGYCLSREDRKLIHEKFRSGEIQILVAVNIYTMGVDFPTIETLFMSRPTLSPVLYAQMVGRGLRGPAFGGTENIRVIDFADQMDTHEHLAERIMNFHREREWTRIKEQWIQKYKNLLKRCKEASTREAIEATTDRSGIYCVRYPSGGFREYRNWGWVKDIGVNIRNGRNYSTIGTKDRVQYILEDIKERGKEGASLLRLVEDNGWILDTEGA